MRKPATSSPSIVAELRARTADAHAKLEHSAFVMPSTRRRASYARLIGAMLSFHEAIEREFMRFEEAFVERGIVMEGRYKAHLLRGESAQLSSPAVDEPVLHYAAAANAVGALYVMEGSTLGGTLIARSVETHLQHSSRYYGCHGCATASRWRETTAQLDAFPLDEREREQMCDGANSTFFALFEHLRSARLG